MTKKKGTSKGRREVVKKAAYVLPAVLTLTAAPSFAQSGSKRAPRRRPRGPADRG